MLDFELRLRDVTPPQTPTFKATLLAQAGSGHPASLPPSDPPDIDVVNPRCFLKYAKNSVVGLINFHPIVYN